MEEKVQAHFMKWKNKDSLKQLALINTSISVAKDLNIKTIAEGVESNDVLSLATDVGCDFGQGYYISCPMPAKDLFKWQREWKGLT